MFAGNLVYWDQKVKAIAVPPPKGLLITVSPGFPQKPVLCNAGI